jgi:hypothetical protein
MQPIRVSASKRYFVYNNGRPFFWLGDTMWELFLKHSLTDIGEILSIRKGQGFSVFQVMITGVGEGDKPNLAGETPWVANDPANPNEAYFAHVDDVIELANRARMVLALGVFHQRQTARITLANARSYARWIAQRYRDYPNIIWSMYPRAEIKYLPLLRELAAGLREGDGGNHLITVHPDPAPTSSSFIHEEPWLDFNSLQTCTLYELIVPMVSADYHRIPIKPVVMAEGGYEGLEFERLQTPLEIRQQAYWSHLAGGHHSYGHNDCWIAPQDWRSWTISPGARQLSIYRRVLTSLPTWWNIVPDQALIMDGVGSGMTMNVAARAANSAWVLVYFSSNARVTLDLACLGTDNVARATWIDPVTGDELAGGRFIAGGTRESMPPSSWQDALLLVQSV